MFALLHGDFEAAAVLAEEVSAWGERAGPDGAHMPLLLQYRAVHRILLLHERDGLGAMVPFAERMKRESRGLPGWQAPLAWCLVQAGYRPQPDGDGGFVLPNCPFHRLSDKHPGVVCTMNGAFLRGAAARLEASGSRVVPADLPGHCCARITPSS